jgi:hypothetical protein
MHRHSPSPDQRPTPEVSTDDLDFFLLDIVSSGSQGLPVFDIDIAKLGECLNCRVPHFTRPELIAALVELHSAGDLEAILEQPRERRLTFQPNGNEIDAAIAGSRQRGR